MWLIWTLGNQDEPMIALELLLRNLSLARFTILALSLARLDCLTSKLTT